MGELIFEARRASYRYPAAHDEAVRAVTLAVPRGELVAIVGPNGSGKTTLLRMLLGVLHPTEGEVLAGGQAAHAWRRRELARLIGVVAQREEPVFPLRVYQAVLLGRYAHLGPFRAARADDLGAVERALARCDVSHLRERWVATLSGGEWQRVRIARALAQEPQALVLDEATANLDVRHEMEVFELTAELVRKEGIAALLVTHHVNLAARFGDRVIVMQDGAIAAQGTPAEVLRRDVLERVFGWPVQVEQWRGVPQFVPLKREERAE